MSYAMGDESWATEGTSPASENGRDSRRMSERVKRDHATMRALLDDVDRACRALEERRPGSLERLRSAVSSLFVAFDEHLPTEEAYLAPLLRTADPSRELLVLGMLSEHVEQRRVILALVHSADTRGKDPGALVAQARALVGALRTDMDSEDRWLEKRGIAPLVPAEHEGG